MRGSTLRVPRGYVRRRVLAESSAHWIVLAQRDGLTRALKIARGDASPVRHEREVLETLVRAPGVSQLVDAGDDWIALAHVEGPTLEERIARKRLSGGEVAVLGARLDDALAAVARAGFVHADVKPANVILPRGRVEDATLVDFETAVRIGSAYSARVTTSFAAPERLVGDARAESRADAFSLGALLFACASGASPFAADSREGSVLRVLALEPPSVGDDAWAGAIAALLDKDPGRRPPSFTAALARARATRVDDDEAPPSSLRDGLRLDASSEPYGSINAHLRSVFAIGKAATFDAIARVMESNMHGVERARARWHAGVLAELLGTEPTGASRDALHATRADSALLARARREAVIAILASPSARRRVVTLSAGVDAASAEIARALVARGAAQKLVVRAGDVGAKTASAIVPTATLVALAAWGAVTPGDIATALGTSSSDVRAELARAADVHAVVASSAPGHFQFSSETEARAVLERADANLKRDVARRVAPAFAARFPQAHARAARLFNLAEEPLRAAYYAWRAARSALQTSDLERAHDVIALGKRALGRATHGHVRALLVALLDVAHSQLLRWTGDLAGSATAARAALASLPAGSAEWCESLGERATVAGKTADVTELLAIASALRQPPTLEARLAWDRACARTAVQLFYLGRRKEALALVEVFSKETTLADGSPDEVRRGLSPGALVTAALYAGRLDEHLTRLEDAVRAFQRIGDVRSECLYGSAVGFALSQLGAYARAERRLRRTADVARKSGVPVLLPLTLHNLGEVLSHKKSSLREALDVESRAVDELRAEGETRFLAGSLAYRARIHAKLGDGDAAEHDAREALAVGGSIDGLRALLFGTLADVMLARGRSDDALVAARTARDAVKQGAPAEAGDALAMVSLVRALEATGARGEARKRARSAWHDVVRRSKQIADATLRASFLDRVPEHRALRALAEAT